MKNIDYNKLKDYVLPGRDPKDTFQASVISAIIWTVFSDITTFFVKYINIRGALLNYGSEDYNNYLWYLREVNGKLMMPEFSTLMRFAFWGADLYITYRIIRAFMDMTYFTKDTKNIYLIRRLGERAPVFKRCWTRALIGIGTALICCLILWGVNYLTYICFTPK